MANSMNKSAAVITGTGANSIIRGAKTTLSGHYSHEPLHVKICVQTGAPLHLIYSESRGFKQGGKRVIMLKIAPPSSFQEFGGQVQVSQRKWDAARSDQTAGSLRPQRTSSSAAGACRGIIVVGSRVTSQPEVVGEIRQSAQMIFFNTF